MARYIDIEKEITEMQQVVEFHKDDKTFDSEIASFAFQAIIDKLKSVPAADVAPVVHAHWIVQKKPVYISSAEYPLCKPTKLYIPDFYNCSICGRREPYQEPYCHCGAKMDEEETEQNGKG